MKACVNGNELDLAEGTTIAELLSRLQTSPNGVAVAKNDCVVRRAAFDEERIMAGDRIEIIRAVAGG